MTQQLESVNTGMTQSYDASNVHQTPGQSAKRANQALAVNLAILL